MEKTQEIQEVLATIKSQTEELLNKKGFISKDEFESKFNQLQEAEQKNQEKLLTVLQKQGADIAAMKEQGQNVEGQSLRKQVENYVTTNKESVKKIKAGHKVELPAFEYKGVPTSPMVPSSFLNSSAYLPVPEINTSLNDLRRVMPTFWDLLPKGRTSQAAYVWVNKTDANGSPAFIGPGVAKPRVSFELTTEISNAKKIAASLKTATELLEDIDGMTSFIEGELSYTVKNIVNTTLMTGTLSSTVPAGVQTFSKSFDLTGINVSDPDLYDAIFAGVTQVRTNYIENPVTVFVNPQDFANLMLAKNTKNRNIAVVYNGGAMYINGALVVQDNNISAGNVQFACLDLLKTLIYKDFTISFGWENDDFTKNLITAVGEIRLHSFHSANDEEGFVYDSFSDIITAIDSGS